MGFFSELKNFLNSHEGAEPQPPQAVEKDPATKRKDTVRTLLYPGVPLEVIEKLENTDPEKLAQLSAESQDLLHDTGKGFRHKSKKKQLDTEEINTKISKRDEERAEAAESEDAAGTSADSTMESITADQIVANEQFRHDMLHEDGKNFKKGGEGMDGPDYLDYVKDKLEERKNEVRRDLKNISTDKTIRQNELRKDSDEHRAA